MGNKHDFKEVNLYNFFPLRKATNVFTSQASGKILDA